MKDKLGAACSGLCVCHCLVTPILIAAGGFGALGALMQSEVVHQALLVPVILLAMLSFPASIRRTRYWWPGILAAVGIGFLVAAQALGHEREAILTVIGGVGVAVAHWLNHRKILRLPARADA